MIVLSQFSKRYGRTVVFDDVDVTIDGPGLTLVLGPNGAGKSTLIRCLLSLEPHGGSILWDGAPFRPARREAYPVFDDAPFYPRLTGRQNLRLLAPEAVGRPSPFLDDHLLRSRVTTYSYGQRKRLALAAAVGSDATTLLLDEPTNGLDVDGLAALRHTLVETAAERTTIVTSHHTDYFAGLARRALILTGNGIRSHDITGMNGTEIDRVYDDARTPVRP